MTHQRKTACGFMDNASALPTTPQAPHQLQRRTYHPLQSADICTRYGQPFRGASLRLVRRMKPAHTKDENLPFVAVANEHHFATDDQGLRVAAVKEIARCHSPGSVP